MTNVMGKALSCDVVVVGAGIVGVCTAYELLKRGMRVLLVDKREPGQECSFGNSGAISPSSVAPLAMPGVLASVPKMLGKPDSPLFLPWWYVPKATPWLARFILSARKETVERSAASLARIHADAVQRHEKMAREVGVPELILRKGHLHLYPDQSSLDGDRAAWELRSQYGFSFTKLGRKEILALEPNVPERYTVGVFLDDQATILNPHRYVLAIHNAFVRLGGQFHMAEVKAVQRPDFPLADREKAQWQIVTADKPIVARQVVVAAGIWSRKLLEPLGIKLHMETQRGYHVQFMHPDSPVSRTVILADHKVFFTPMESGLRVGGTVEFAGVKAGPNDHRSQILLRLALEHFKSLQGKPYQTWMGHRPCLPDTVPVIGQAQDFLCDSPASRNSPRLPGLWIATGHGHLGLTDSVGTAMQIADGVCGV